jgi:uncharacterized protein (TIGR02757 family)
MPPWQTCDSLHAMTDSEIKELLDYWAKEVEENAFIPNDPVQIPHRYTRMQDIEISGFFAAIMAWGQRKTIIKSAQKLMLLMDDVPYDFVMQHEASDLKRLESCVHRTLNGTDVISMIKFFREWYQGAPSLEDLFFCEDVLEAPVTDQVYRALMSFQHAWQQFPHEKRTYKHLASPEKGSACKRLNMYFRWMIRRNSAVDFGIWKKVDPAVLVCPLDVHVQRVAIELGLLKRDKSDWQSCMELTDKLRGFRASDPVYYDYALFGIGVARNKEIIA